MDALLARHKKEQRDLVSQITGLKKQATKKNRKQVLAQCADLQEALNNRQKQESDDLCNSAKDTDDAASRAQLETNPDLNELDSNSKLGVLKLESAESEIKDFNSKDTSANGSSTNSSPHKKDELTPEQLLESINIKETPLSPVSGSQESQKPKKRNRAKERLAKRQAQVDAIRAEALSEAAATPDYRAIEAETMNQLLVNRELKLHEIQPDGHCLFRSISDQLLLRHETNVSVQDLRTAAAKHIRDNRDEFVPYLFDEETMAIRDPEDYTKELETTAMWGSDMEILALARVYGCPVEVLTAGSAPITFNAEGENPKLLIAFYKHTYGLGEHYNSCR